MASACLAFNQFVAPLLSLLNYCMLLQARLRCWVMMRMRGLTCLCRHPGEQQQQQGPAQGELSHRQQVGGCMRVSAYVLQSSHALRHTPNDSRKGYHSQSCDLKSHHLLL